MLLFDKAISAYETPDLRKVSMLLRVFLLFVSSSMALFAEFE